MSPLGGAYDKAYQLEVYTENASWPEPKPHPTRRKKTMANKRSKAPLYLAVAYSNIKNARPGVAVRVRGASGSSRVLRNGKITFTTYPTKSCGAAKKAAAKLTERLRREGIRGKAGVARVFPAKWWGPKSDASRRAQLKSRIRKCPR